MVNELLERVIGHAVEVIGRKEVGNNAGAWVEMLLARLGLPPGNPWCVAFVYWLFDELCMEMRLTNPLPRTGKVTHFWQRCPSEWKTQTPERGAIFCHADHPEDPESDGHLGLVIAVGGSMNLSIDGNTNALGSRDGTTVAVKLRSHAFVNLGYIYVPFAAPAALVG